MIYSKVNSKKAAKTEKLAPQHYALLKQKI